MGFRMQALGLRILGLSGFRLEDSGSPSPPLGPFQLWELRAGLGNLKILRKLGIRVFLGD